MAARGANPFLRLYQQLASVGGALALLQIFRDLLELKQFFRDVLDAWAAIVRPVTEFLFGWLDLVFGFELPRYAHDYMIVGFILFMGAIRGELIYDQSMRRLAREFQDALGPIRKKITQIPPVPKDATREDRARLEKERSAEERALLEEMEPIYQKFGFRSPPEKLLGTDSNRDRPFMPWIHRFISTALFWPYTYTVYIGHVFSIDWSKSPISKWEFLFDLFAPFLYFMIVILANYFLFIA